MRRWWKKLLNRGTWTGSISFSLRMWETLFASSYDLGEELRFVLLSATEGEDKPLKYPTIFNSSDVAIITKMDLAEAAEFDLAAARRNIESVRPGMQLFEVSAKTGTGMQPVFDLLHAQLARSRHSQVVATL
jgi:hydrogenase nickel incorporation protein HypB